MKIKPVNNNTNQQSFGIKSFKYASEDAQIIFERFFPQNSLLEELKNSVKPKTGKDVDVFVDLEQRMYEFPKLIFRAKVGSFGHKEIKSGKFHAIDKGANAIFHNEISTILDRDIMKKIDAFRNETLGQKLQKFVAIFKRPKKQPKMPKGVFTV